MLVGLLILCFSVGGGSLRYGGGVLTLREISWLEFTCCKELILLRGHALGSLGVVLVLSLVAV